MASFSGGEALRRRLREIEDKIVNKGELRVGLLEGSGTHPNSDLSIPTIGAIHEFGAPNAGIPPRPFMRPTLKAKQGEWAEIVAQQLPRVDYDLRTTLAALGEVAVADVKQTITDMKSPPLKPATVERKGFDALLVDTKVMRDSIASEVTE